MGCLIVLTSCAKNKSTTNTTDTIFLEGIAVGQDETYAVVKGTAARLRALMCGKFVQYQRENNNYKVWLVNDGQDSIIAYLLPVGDHHKAGYWLYQYYAMSSLMDEPLSQYLYKLNPIGRDTLELICHDLPADFNPPLEEVLLNPIKSFSKVDFKTLKKAPTPVISFVRQTPIRYNGTTPMLVNDTSGFIQGVFNVEPARMSLGESRYNKDKEPTRSSMNRLVKLATIRSKWLD